MNPVTPEKLELAKRIVRYEINKSSTKETGGQFSENRMSYFTSKTIEVTAREMCRLYSRKRLREFVKETKQTEKENVGEY